MHSLAGFSEEEITEYNINSMTDEELYNLVRRRLLDSMTNNGSSQKIIPLSDIEKYLGEGWEYVSSLPNEKAIIKIPY